MADNNTLELFKDHATLLRHVAATAPLIFWAVDRDGIIYMSEGRGLETLGYQDHELVGQSVYELYAERPDLIDNIHRALAGESFVAKVLLNDHHLESHYAPARDEEGHIKGVVGIVRDMTAHTEALNALRNSEQRSTLAQQAGQVGIWDWNILANEVYWSDIIEAMFGLKPGEFSGAYEDYLARVHPDDRDMVVNTINASLEQHTPYRIQHRICWANGDIRWLYAAGEVFRDDKGIPYRMLGTVQDITERIIAEQKHLESERNLELSQQLAKIGSWSWDVITNQVTWSRQLYYIYGLDPETFNGDILQHVVDATHPEDAKRVEQSITDYYDSHEENQIEYRIIRPDGEVRKVWGLGKAIFGANNNLIRRVGIVQDITEKSDANHTMRKLSHALEQTDDLVLITNYDGVIEFVNQAFEATTGYSQEELLGNKPSIVKSGEHNKKFYTNLWDTILTGTPFRSTLVNRRKDGTTYHEEKTITPLVDDNGNITHFISTGKDITDRVKDQQRMQYLAHHDLLTELPNRVLFSDRLEHALHRRGQNNKKLALIFMDLDRFKMINDTLGHDAGDRFLQFLSARLRLHLREEDTIARLGGDEFAVILEDIDSAAQAGEVARKILAALAKPFELDKRELFVTASIGISLFPADGDNSQTLLKNADIAMYRAKDLGRNTYQFYSSEMSSKALQRLNLETSLRHALERDEFVLHYQPQVDLSAGRTIGTEALLRWQHPDLGLISPIDFIPILEETGLIVDVGKWVLQQACQQTKEWNSFGQPLSISVNVSTRQFASRLFGKTVKKILKDTSLDANLLDLEITESILLNNTPDIVKSFDQLLKTNIRLALDDFGTGYSSLSYLKKFPINILKIDRSFVRDITTDPDDASIIEAILALAKSLNIQVIAEGVETRQQQQFLHERGCNVMQGFYFSPPVPAAQIPALLNGQVPIAQIA